MEIHKRREGNLPARWLFTGVGSGGLVLTAVFTAVVVDTDW